jgi:hypothetical protein
MDKTNEWKTTLKKYFKEYSLLRSEGMSKEEASDMFLLVHGIRPDLIVFRNIYFDGYSFSFTVNLTKVGGARGLADLILHHDTRMNIESRYNEYDGSSNR